MKPRTLLVTAFAIVATHLLLRVCGAGEHASVLVGMPQSAASYVVGPLLVLFALAAVVLAPILVLVAGFEAIATKITRSSAAPHAASRNGSPGPSLRP